MWRMFEQDEAGGSLPDQIRWLSEILTSKRMRRDWNLASLRYLLHIRRFRDFNRAMITPIRDERSIIIAIIVRSRNSN